MDKGRGVCGAGFGYANVRNCVAYVLAFVWLSAGACSQETGVSTDLSTGVQDSGGQDNVVHRADVHDALFRLDLSVAEATALDPGTQPDGDQSDLRDTATDWSDLRDISGVELAIEMIDSVSPDGKIPDLPDAAQTLDALDGESTGGMDTTLPDTCEPSCDGLECGDDGCGGICGECQVYETCDSGACTCSYSICNGDCCPDGALCEEDGCCVPTCVGHPPGTLCCSEEPLCYKGQCVPDLLGVISIGRGQFCFHACMIGWQGEVWCWGWNGSGQLGIPSGPDQHVPHKVETIDHVVSVAVGPRTTCAVDRNALLWCWGTEITGEPYAPSSSIPTKTDLANITAVALGSAHACALDGEGFVWCWGDNDYEQLGSPEIANSAEPVLVEGLPACAALAVGGDHSCCLSNEGEVWCWGRNDAHQSAAQGGQEPWALWAPVPPTKAMGLPPIVQVACGSWATLALDDAGTVWGWGSHFAGQVPAQVEGLDAATAVAAGVDHFCATDVSGSLWCWGSGSALGQCLPMGMYPPQLVSAVGSVATVTAGTDHTCVLDKSGHPWCWGGNTQGELGMGEGGAVAFVPEQVTDVTSAVSVSVGTSYSCVVDSVGSVSCWGYLNQDYCPSIPVSSFAAEPVPMPISFPVGRLNIGAQGYCFMEERTVSGTRASDGALWAMPNGPPCTDGLSFPGVQGTSPPSPLLGTSHDTWQAAKCGYAVVGSQIWKFNEEKVSYKHQCEQSIVSLAQLQGMGCSGDYTPICAVWEDGSVTCNSSQLACESSLGNNVPFLKPIELAVPAVQIAMGEEDACVIKKDGSVWCAGKNTFGLLFNPDDEPVPEEPKLITDSLFATDVVVGAHHGCLLTVEGLVFCWGSGGNLGNPTLMSSENPVQVQGLSEVVAMEAKYGLTCAVTQAGTTHCWGVGWLGNGWKTSHCEPQKVASDFGT